MVTQRQKQKRKQLQNVFFWECWSVKHKYTLHVHLTTGLYIYIITILPVVLYGCETWSLKLREERKLRVFENMVLRRIFGPRRDEVTGNGGDCITRS